MSRRSSALARFNKRKHVHLQRRRLRVFYAEKLTRCNVKKPRVVVLTGAGISAESGIRTFRAEDGLWEEHRVEDVATPEGFRANRALVQKFYNDRRRQLHQSDIKPNAAHLALAKLEDYLGDNLLLVTQNIDNLHERAGSKNIIHMHGELLKMRCEISGEVFDWGGDIEVDQKCECCHMANTLRPHIVWFGEMPFGMDGIYAAIEKADYFISIGTSGNVYPAAGFVQHALAHHVHTVELNLEPSLVQNQFAEKHYGPATNIVPDYVAKCIRMLKTQESL